jgi:hypothetical protein
MADAAKIPDVIDVGGEVVGEEIQTYQEDGGILTGFIQGIGAFLTKARSLEAKADAIAARSKALVMPTNADEDAAMQRFVQEASTVTKAIESHWTVTSTFSQFHRRLTAARGRATEKSDGAGARAQRFHNEYVAAAKRRAAEETARQEQAAREEAERRRQAELAASEAEAVKREEAAADLSDREKAFVTLFLGGMKAQEAAKRAGYKDAVATAARLTTSGKIQAAIKAAQEAAAIRKQAEARKAAPLEVREVETVKPDVLKEGTDRKTWRGELVDLESLMTAFLGCKPADYQNRFGIPADLFTVDQAKLTEYARAMHAGLNRWPGVKAIEKTTTI